MANSIEPTLGRLLKEFETIRSSLVPVIEEVKKIKETKIELERTKREFEAKLKRIDFEVRSIKQKKDIPKDVAILQDRVTRLSKELNILKSAKMPAVKQEFHEEIDEKSITQKTALTKLKNSVEDMNKTHLGLINSTREKTASLISEVEQLKKDVVSTVETEVKISKILSEFEKFKNHEQQIVNELNKHKIAILKTVDDVKKQVNKTEAIAVATTKIDKKQASDINDVKNRIYQLEKRIGQNGIEEIRKNIEMFKEKTFGELDKARQRLTVLEKKHVERPDISRAVKDVIATENVQINNFVKELKSQITNLGNRTDDVVKELDSINIKVNSTSKIISEIEKVL